MASGVATVTAKTGPAVQNTAVVISAITFFSVDLARQVIYFIQLGSSQIREYDLTGVVTFTVVIAAGVYTITIS